MIYPSALLIAWFSTHFILRHGMISAQTKARIKLLGDKQKKQKEKIPRSAPQREEQSGLSRYLSVVED